MSATPRLVLAPLAGFTDAAMRQLCTEGGADAVFTEMVSAAALAHQHLPTNELLATLPDEKHVSVQLVGAKEEELAFATRHVSSLGRFCEVNLNAGCPMTKVVRTGSGAKLVESPEKVYSLLKAMRENTALAVTLKTRLGAHPAKTAIFELLDAAERAGATQITIHARYTSQMHSGDVHLDLLREVVNRAKIPVCGNGSIRSSADCQAMADTGVSAIMIGRAALAAPDIFNELKGAAQRDLKTLFRRHLQLLKAFHPIFCAARGDAARSMTLDAYVALKARTHLFRYFAGIPGAAALRARFNSVRTLADVEALAPL